MNLSDDVSYYIKENLKIKEAKYGTPKKKYSDKTKSFNRKQSHQTLK
jgi:hypothetical protein